MLGQRVAIVQVDPEDLDAAYAGSTTATPQDDSKMYELTLGMEERTCAHVRINRITLSGDHQSTS